MGESSPDLQSSRMNPTTSLVNVLVFTFLNSLGSGLVNNGVYFLTTHHYKFSKQENFMVGIVIGVTYIFGALAAGRGVNAIRRAIPGLSTRGVLIALMIVMGLICLIPAAASAAHSSSISIATDDHRPGAWPIWIVIVLYSPLTGVLWPLTESYLSGGKSGKQLRNHIGLFNITWSGSVLVALLALSPFIEDYSTQCFVVLGAVHIVMGIALPLMFFKEPAPHRHDEHEPHPPVYRQLLVTFRLLLPLAYIISSSLSPFLPSIMKTLNVEARYQPMLATAWLLPRTITFIAARYYHGWHGRWSMPIIGMLLMVGGCAATVLSPQFGRFGCTDTQCILIMVAGLAAFGTGMSLIYTGALYYAMEVGAAEVDAGGTHEALIGVGYLVGPLCGLLPALGVEYNIIASGNFENWMLTLVGIIAAVVVTATIVRVKAATAAMKAGAS